jgi:hypothetical protein
VLAVVVAALLARAFNPAGAVLDAHARAAVGTPREEDARTVRTALASANRRSLLLVLAVALVPTAASALGSPLVPDAWTVIAGAVILATGLDLADEVAARLRLGPLAAAWRLHRVYLPHPVLASLEAAGIPAHARGRRFRALFHLFAPFAPVDVLVPADRLAEAEAVCARFAR